MIENKRLVSSRKKNMKLYPLYRMWGVDIIFLYAIRMLFLTQVKGFSSQDVVFVISLYALFMVILQVPATILIKKIGYVKSAFLSNVCNIVYITLLIFNTNIVMLFFAEFICALTFSIKDVAEPSLINNSIPKTKKKGNIYSKLEGKGTSRYNFLNAIADIVSGSVYLINPYLPLILAIICSVIACIIILQFDELSPNKKNDKDDHVIKNYISDLKISFKFILQSKRLRCLLLYSGLFWGLRCLVVSYKDSILVEIGTSAVIIGVVSALLEISAAVAAKKQGKFHKKFRNKSLTYIAMSFALCTIFSGLIVVFKAPFILELAIIVLSFIIISADNVMSGILVNRYLANFSTPDILLKIYSANAIARNIFRFLFGLFGSLLMGLTDTANAMTIFGIFTLIIMIILFKEMKTRVGLKPEQYDAKDIEFKINA